MPACSIHSFLEMRERAQRLGPKRVGVVMADDLIALTAVRDAWRLDIASPVLIGDEAKIRSLAAASGLDDLLRHAQFVPTDRPAAIAAKLACDGEIDVILKGHLRTDELLHAVLDKQSGLRTGNLLSDVLFYEDTLSGHKRLVGITDGGLNVAPDRDQKEQIIRNAVSVLRCLGFVRPKIAVMSATESVSQNLPSTTDAAALTAIGRQGGFGEAEVFGPLALDNALLLSAAEAEGNPQPGCGPRGLFGRPLHRGGQSAG